ncbi:MAG: sulfatase [Planctomycetota bacterium]|nr:sulfatase [Planctomycetota bacterium]
MRCFSFASLVAPLVVAACLPAQGKPLSGARPNIIFVFSDDHAAHAISAYGSKINKTPNIDRIASEGLLFRNNFCGNALCGPSRATILTGLHSHANGFMRNGNVFDGGQTTFPKLLQRVGYQTAIIGKWHLSSDPQGFDHWVVLPGQGQYYNPDFIVPDPDSDSGRKRVRYEGHATDLTTKLSLQWLDQRDPDKPFLLMCQHKAPHRNWMPAAQDLALFQGETIPEPVSLFDDYEGRGPMAKAQEMSIAKHMFLHYDLIVPPADESQLKGTDRAWLSQRKRMNAAQLKAWDAAFQSENDAFLREDPQGDARVRWAYQRYIKNYLRCVNGVDRSVGELLAWLDERPEVKKNTVIIYSSDQGFYLGDHGWYDKRWMYEESLRMPLVMRWPEHLAAGEEVSELTQNIDFAPTFLDLAGVPAPSQMHGKSMVPILGGGRSTATSGDVPDDVAAVQGGEKGWRDAIYYHYYESQAVHMVPAMYGVRTERFKLVRYYEPQWDTWEMFDLKLDRAEMINIADDPRYKTTRAYLEGKLRDLRAEYQDDTGQVGDGAFPVTAGVARCVPAGEGCRVWFNAPGGYLMKQERKQGPLTVSTTMSPRSGRLRRNGSLLLTGAGPRGPVMRVTVEFGTGQLVVEGPRWRQAAGRAKLDWDGAAAVQVQVSLDFEAHELVAEALGQRVAVAIPAKWAELTGWGLGGNNAETVFGPVVFR